MRRELDVASLSGLANRLRVLTSGVALAEATDRSFRMLWPDDRHTCGAAFHHLFESDLNVIDLPEAEIRAAFARDDWWIGDGNFSALPDLVADDRQTLRCCYVAWLVDPAVSPTHRSIIERAHAVLDDLRLRPELRRRVDEIASQFVPPVVGVHLRRGDFLSARANVVGNLDVAIGRVKRDLDAGANTVFLATDDGADPRMDAGARGRGAEVREGVRAAFRAEFGERLVETHPRSLDRSATVAVEDAVVDLWTLRRTDTIVGTATSSFTELAAAGRDVPLFEAAGAARPYGRLDRAIAGIGLASAIERVGRLIYGRDVSAVALTHRASAPMRSVARPFRRAMRRRRRDGGR